MAVAVAPPGPAAEEEPPPWVLETLGQGRLFAGAPTGKPPLEERFLVPPFSILDARQGYWRERKAEWVAWGIRGHLGRKQDLLGTGSLSVMNPVAAAAGYGKKLPPPLSIFDPVLAEVVYRWFCPAGGAVLDPFAGEATKGLVAAAVGLKYVGIELRPEQVEENERQAGELGVAPRWLCGNSTHLTAHLGPGDMFDLVFTSPPYYDLEVYSEGDGDTSAVGSYVEFLRLYNSIFQQALERLRPDRFAVVKVGEIRDERGIYRNFVADTVRVFQGAGLHYYNEAIFVTPLGSVPVRAGGHFMAGRKLEKTHQQLLVFWKGNPRRVKEVFG